MKKVLFIVALLGSVVASADTDSYLYWMVGEGAPEYTRAAIRYADSSSYLLNYYEPAGTQIGTDGYVSKTVIDDVAEWGDVLYAGVDSSDLPKSFVVELWNGDAWVGQSIIDSSVAQNYIYGGGMSIPSAMVASITSVSIPEPNSALLMLVGCAMLGLRRRKLKVA